MSANNNLLGQGQLNEHDLLQGKPIAGEKPWGNSDDLLEQLRNDVNSSQLMDPLDGEADEGEGDEDYEQDGIDQESMHEEGEMERFEMTQSLANQIADQHVTLGQMTSDPGLDSP